MKLKENIITTQFGDTFCISTIHTPRDLTINHYCDNSAYYLYDKHRWEHASWHTSKSGYLDRRVRAAHDPKIRHCRLFAADALGLPVSFCDSIYSVNHKNNNGLDDRSNNLNIVTHAENVAHAQTYNGVYYNEVMKGWVTQIEIGSLRKRIRALVSNTYEEAQSIRQWVYQMLSAGITPAEIKLEIAEHKRTVINPVPPENTIANEYDYLIAAHRPDKKAYMRSIGFEIDDFGNII